VTDYANFPRKKIGSGLNLYGVLGFVAVVLFFRCSHVINASLTRVQKKLTTDSQQQHAKPRFCSSFGATVQQTFF